jgi:crotonobetainyl-CoA:carnitine CoA-transferase CaiB-like acyl-CoA transferase
MGPLTGLQVLELGNVIAAPTAGRVLADFGARVVKVEHPEFGDDLRRWPPTKNGLSLWWKVTNRSKDLITLNLGETAGQALVRRIIPKFDVLIENFRPGTMEKWALGYEGLAAINPRLIMVRISGYGQSGPYASRAGYGTVAEAMSGLPSFTGPADGPPTLSAFPLVDSLAGQAAAQAALMAVYERDVAGSGLGQLIDVSLYESIFRLLESPIVAYDQLGIVKRRNGNRMDEDSPRNTYLTQDGEYIALSAGSQRTFSRLATSIGQPQLSADERFASNELRCRNADLLDEILSDWFRNRTLADAMAQLEADDVIAGPVYDVERIFNDAQYAAREDIVPIADPDLGSLRMPAVLPKFSRTPGGIRWSGGSIGEANHRFFIDEVGLSAGELSQLSSHGVV